MRQMRDAEVIETVSQIDPYVFRSPHFIKLTSTTACNASLLPWSNFMRSCANTNSNVALASFREHLNQPHADAIFGLCERLVARP